MSSFRMERQTAWHTDGQTDTWNNDNTRRRQWRPRVTRTTRTPAFWGYPTPPHDYPNNWVILDPKSKEDKVKVTNLKNSPKFQIFESWNKHYTRHTFWSCLIRCANMKWIRWLWALLKIQSGHDSVHRRTDGQMDKVKPVCPPGVIKMPNQWEVNIKIKVKPQPPKPNTEYNKSVKQKAVLPSFRLINFNWIHPLPENFPYSTTIMSVSTTTSRGAKFTHHTNHTGKQTMAALTLAWIT